MAKELEDDDPFQAPKPKREAPSSRQAPSGAAGAFGCRWWESQGHIFPWRCRISASPTRISAYGGKSSSLSPIKLRKKHSKKRALISGREARTAACADISPQRRVAVSRVQSACPARGAGDLVGVAAPRLAIERALARFAGDGLCLLLVTGPPGSGKTTLVNRALAGTDFVVYRSTADETVTREMALVDRFCRTVHSVHALLEGRRACRRAVFLDDCLPDARSISKVYDMLKLAGARVMVIACLGQSIKAPEAHRRAAEVVRVRYPAPPVTAEHILVAFRDGQASPEAARRCAEAAGGCVPKAEQLLRSELYGTRAVEALRGVDTTIFEDVARAVALARRGRPFPDVEVAISNEPSLRACASGARWTPPGCASRAATPPPPRGP
eukprot:jgi/Tetstr1/454086/TSEL_041005.t1